VICDEVLGEGCHEVEVWLPLPATSGSGAGAEALLELAGGRTVRVAALSGFRSMRVERPQTKPAPGWYSPRYGVRCAGTAVCLASGPVNLPQQLVLLLVSGQNESPDLEGATRKPTMHETEQGDLIVRLSGATLTLPSGGGLHLTRETHEADRNR
jgi:hypothetical protein